MSYKKYNWEVVAHDYNSPYIRNYIWTKAFFRYPKDLKVRRILLGTVAYDNNLQYVGDMETWNECHEELKAKALKKRSFISDIIKKTQVEGVRMNNWSETNIFKADLTKLSDSRLLALYKKFIDWESILYAYGVALPVLDFQNFSFVENNLKSYLQEHVSSEKYNRYFSVFTEPSHHSFAQEEQIALLKLADSFYANSFWRRSVLNSQLHEIVQKYPEFCRKLKTHAKKYGWVYFVYNGPAFTEKEFLQSIKTTLEKGQKPKQLLNNIDKRHKQTKLLKEKYIKELKPDAFNEHILRLAGDLVWGKPRRKDYQSKTYFHAQVLFKEIGRRLHLSLDQVKSTPIKMISDGLLKGREVDVHEVNIVRRKHACLPNDDGTIELLLDKEADKFMKKVKRSKVKERSHKNTIYGDVACSGKAKGIVCIVNSLADVRKMKEGNILVSTATTPSIILALKKAAAIVTDEGGLTSHASIVSRELNVPCVIGTKIATKFLKDGYKVIVDATEGVVRII